MQPIRNVVLDGRPLPMSSSEKDLTRQERSTLAQLRSGYCRLLGSYKSRIKKDASLNVCADWGTTPHDVKHLFVYPAHPTTMILSYLWSRLTDAVREISYLEARNPDWNEHGLKGEQQQQITSLLSSLFIYQNEIYLSKSRYKIQSNYYIKWTSEYDVICSHEPNKKLVDVEATIPCCCWGTQLCTFRSRRAPQ